jgi:hypothetical protein
MSIKYYCIYAQHNNSWLSYLTLLLLGVDLMPRIDAGVIVADAPPLGGPGTAPVVSSGDNICGGPPDMDVAGRFVPASVLPGVFDSCIGQR